MKLEKKCLVIIKNRKRIYVESCNGQYCFPVFMYMAKGIAEKYIIETYINEKPKREKDYEGDNYIAPEFWTVIEHINYACDKKELFYCYILKIGNSNLFPTGSTIVDMDEISPDCFCDNQRKTYEFIRAIPDLDSLNDEELYGQVYYENEQINISLINKRLLEMELDSIERDEAFPLFFYEFFSANITHINLDYFNNGEQGDKLYSIKIMDKNAADSSLKSRQRNTDIVAEADGRIVFSASPIIGRNGNHIVIKPLDNSDTERRIMKLYKRLMSIWENRIYTKTIRDRNTIQRRLDSLYSKVRPSDIRVKVFNVGQANCCFCDLQDRKLFFDIGVTYREKIKNNSSIDDAVNRYISKINADDVFVSHWDLDHILGVVYNRNVLSNKIWLGPDFKLLHEKQGRKVSISIINLVYYLIFVGKSEVMLIDTSSTDKTLFESDTLSIYLGTPVTTSINILNNGGIIMKLQNRKNMLFPGDCDNNVIPKLAISDTFDNIVVPHHGSIMGDPIFIGKDPNGNNCAYICIGKTTGKFCEDKYIDGKYYNNNFKFVFRTKNLTKRSYFVVKL